MVFAEPVERLRPLHHKYLFVCKAADYGLTVPETMIIESADDAQRAFDRWDALVLKPAYSHFASKTLIRDAHLIDVLLLCLIRVIGVSPTRPGSAGLVVK